MSSPALLGLLWAAMFAVPVSLLCLARPRLGIKPRKRPASRSAPRTGRQQAKPAGALSLTGAAWLLAINVVLLYGIDSLAFYHGRPLMTFGGLVPLIVANLVVVTITPFGRNGPWVGRPWTEFTLQAACGSTGNRGLPEQPPLAAGGRIGEWVAGTYAALAALAAHREARRSGRGEDVDVALLDCMAVTMTTYPSVFASFFGAGGPRVAQHLQRLPWSLDGRAQTSPAQTSPG